MSMIGTAVGGMPILMNAASSVVGAGLSFISVLVAAISYFRYGVKQPMTTHVHKEVLFREYDFVIVGSGSAGAVVANRLSEISDWNVLLLEAGGDETAISDVPVLAKNLQLTKLDWQYKTEPQENACLGMKDQRCNWPRGKVLGGSSVLNYMQYVRGNAHDYRLWEEAGNTGWGENDALYYFKKSEDNRNPDTGRTHYHSTGGYLTIQEAPWHTPLATSFVQAGSELGYEIRDINGEKQTGFMLSHGTIRNGSRCSTAKAFLRPVRHRKNLHVVMHAHVTRVLIDHVHKKAFGVEFMRHGKIKVVKSRKEVILSGGAVASPHILMLSGVGPRAHLKSHGIYVISDLKVGQNLQDQAGLGGLTFMVNEPVSMVSKRYEKMTTVMKYAKFGEGPLTVMGTVEGLAFVNTKYANTSIDYPDIELHFLCGSTNSDGGRQIRKAHGITDEMYETVFRPIDYKDVWSVIPVLLRPQSKGEILLRSRDPYDHPLIYPNYFSHPSDLATLIQGVKIVITLSQTKAFRKYGSNMHTTPFPGCRHIEMFTDEYWACMIKHYTVTAYNPVGTCKMGPNRDPEAVVDPRLKVYGVKGLRVIDASVIPRQISGNINAPVIMVAEKGSDMIKEDWKKL